MSICSHAPQDPEPMPVAGRGACHPEANRPRRPCPIPEGAVGLEGGRGKKELWLTRGLTPNGLARGSLPG